VESLPVDYAEAAALMDAGHMEMPEELCRRIAMDLPLRRANTESFAPTASATPRVVRWAFYGLAYGGLVAWTILAHALGLGLLATISLVACFLLPWTILRSNRRYCECATSIRGVCVGCGYDLAGLQDAIPRERVGSASIGPRRCPECAADWPRVPRTGG
jgi:hypothetical protein